jgi:hypothetical protein
MRGSRIAVTTIAAAALLVAAGPARGADDNILRNDKGIVTYGVRGAPPQSLVGSISVGDTVITTTAIASLAALQLSDSSEIRIGDRTTVEVGALRTAAAAAGPASATIELVRGAVRFNIKHPSGAKSNYVFKTITSQLAVRGTVGYFISGPGGDQVYCVRCDEGDVTVTVGTQTYSVRTGQTLNALANATPAIVQNRTINNPAINQFLGGVSPFGEASSNGNDPTLSGSVGRL